MKLEIFKQLMSEVTKIRNENSKINEMFAQ